jgi:hypothetical protein
VTAAQDRARELLAVPVIDLPADEGELLDVIVQYRMSCASCSEMTRTRADAKTARVPALGWRGRGALVHARPSG